MRVEINREEKLQRFKIGEVKKDAEMMLSELGINYEVFGSLRSNTVINSSDLDILVWAEDTIHELMNTIKNNVGPVKKGVFEFDKQLERQELMVLKHCTGIKVDISIASRKDHKQRVILNSELISWYTTDYTFKLTVQAIKKLFEGTPVFQASKGGRSDNEQEIESKRVINMHITVTAWEVIGTQDEQQYEAIVLNCGPEGSAMLINGNMRQRFRGTTIFAKPLRNNMITGYQYVMMYERLFEVGFKQFTYKYITNWFYLIIKEFKWLNDEGIDSMDTKDGKSTMKIKEEGKESVWFKTTNKEWGVTGMAIIGGKPRMSRVVDKFYEVRYRREELRNGPRFWYPNGAFVKQKGKRYLTGNQTIDDGIVGEYEWAWPCDKKFSFERVFYWWCRVMDKMYDLWIYGVVLVEEIKPEQLLKTKDCSFLRITGYGNFDETYYYPGITNELSKVGAKNVIKLLRYVMTDKLESAWKVTGLKYLENFETTEGMSMDDLWNVYRSDSSTAILKSVL
eukprot:sb/3463970/